MNPRVRVVVVVVVVEGSWGGGGGLGVTGMLKKRNRIELLRGTNRVWLNLVPRTVPCFMKKKNPTDKIGRVSDP